MVACGSPTYHLPVSIPPELNSLSAFASSRPSPRVAASWVVVARRCTVALLFLAGCQSPQEYREQADREVYALIDARRMELFADRPGFNIEPHSNSLRQRVLRGEWAPEEPLNLLDCLGIAAENNRDYQTRKERLYLVALDLTLERWQFRNQGFAIFGASVTGTGSEAETANADGEFGFTRLLGSGALIVGSVGLDLFRMLSTGDPWDAITDLGISVTQPLLRGAGKLVTLEPLTQAERDLVYEVRDFERFRRTFAVDVERHFLDLMQNINELENEENNYANLVALSEYTQAMVDAGRLSEIEAGQARQQELQSETNLIRLRGILDRARDDFNIFLGLPVETLLVLDRAEFEALDEEAPLLDIVVEDRAVGFALDSRLDFQNQVDRLTDQERRVAIAEDALRAGLTLAAGADSVSTSDDALDHDSERIAWSASL